MQKNLYLCGFWTFENLKTVAHIKLASIDAKLSASKKKSHNFQDEWAVSIGIAHFQKKDKLEFHSTERRNRINSPYSTLRVCDS